MLAEVFMYRGRGGSFIYGTIFYQVLKELITSTKQNVQGGAMILNADKLQTQFTKYLILFFLLFGTTGCALMPPYGVWTAFRLYNNSGQSIVLIHPDDGQCFRLKEKQSKEIGPVDNWKLPLTFFIATQKGEMYLFHLDLSSPEYAEYEYGKFSLKHCTKPTILPCIRFSENRA